VAGRTVKLGETTYTVAGVTPRGFWFPETADVYVPLVATARPTTGHEHRMIARLKPDVEPSAWMPSWPLWRRIFNANTPMPGTSIAGSP